jgi:hypothetical protein
MLPVSKKAPEYESGAQKTFLLALRISVEYYSYL